MCSKNFLSGSLKNSFRIYFWLCRISLRFSRHAFTKFSRNPSEIYWWISSKIPPELLSVIYADSFKRFCWKILFWFIQENSLENFPWNYFQCSCKSLIIFLNFFLSKIPSNLRSFCRVFSQAFIQEIENVSGILSENV